MRRRSATTGLIMEASCVLQETVRVFSEPERGAAILALGTVLRKVASCRTRAANLISEFVILPWRLSNIPDYRQCQGAKEVARPDSDLFWPGRATRILLLGPTRHKTIYGWDLDEQSLPGVLVETPPGGRALYN